MYSRYSITILHFRLFRIYTYFFWFLAQSVTKHTMYILFKTLLLPSTNTLFIHCVYTVGNIVRVEADTLDKNVHSFKAYKYNYNTISLCFSLFR